MAGFFETIAALRERAPLLAAWGIDGAFAGARALYARDGDLCEEMFRDAAFPADFAGALQSGPRGRWGIVECGNARIFLEPLAQGRKLVICGAGHVALAVIRLGVMLDFEVTVIDDRQAFVERAKAAGAHRAVCSPFGEALQQTGGDPSTAFVVMTREHAHDVECLRWILPKCSAYVGMMGSRSRTEQIRQLLLDEGFDAEAVRKAHMPIGLPIGSKTPEEIAVSVMAQVIQVMNACDAGEAFPPGMLEELIALENGKTGPAVLAMIVEKTGEAPRRPGTKLLVKADGRFVGTVGGGTAEAVILRTAGSMLREGCRDSRLVRINLEKGAMYCGGEIAVFMLPL